MVIKECAGNFDLLAAVAKRVQQKVTKCLLNMPLQFLPNLETLRTLKDM